MARQTKTQRVLHRLQKAGQVSYSELTQSLRCRNPYDVINRLRRKGHIIETEQQGGQVRYRYHGEQTAPTNPTALAQ